MSVEPGEMNESLPSRGHALRTSEGMNNIVDKLNDDLLSLRMLDQKCDEFAMRAEEEMQRRKDEQSFSKLMESNK